MWHIQKDNIRAKGSVSDGHTTRLLFRALRRVRIVKSRSFPIVSARFAGITRDSRFLILKKKKQLNKPNPNLLSAAGVFPEYQI